MVFFALVKISLAAALSMLLFTGANARELTHLELDEGSGDVALDSSGLGNDGALLGNPVYVADTGDGSAFGLGFDGIDDSIDLGPLDVAGSGLTLAAWFKADRYPGTYRDPRLISKASGTAANAHVFMLSTIRSGTQTRLRARVRVGGVTTTLVAASGNLQTGVWQHGALSYDGAFLRLYLNGVEVGRTALTGAVDTDPSLAVAVGSQPGSSARWFDGLIDDVLILERGMAAAELLAIVAGNGAPTGVADSYQIDEDTPLSVAALEGVLANDSDPDNDPLAAELVETVSHGTLVLEADGGFDYSPAPDYAGADSFSYRARDASLSSPTVTVSLLVGAVGDEPQAMDDNYQTVPNQPLAVGSVEGVLANDSDIDSANLEAVLLTDVSNGALILNADGSFNYTPAPDFSGSDSFTYVASDGALESLPATVGIVISAPPVAADDRYEVTEDTLLVIPPLTGVLANDADTHPPSDLSALLVSGPSHGTLTQGLGGDGGFSYLPGANYAGEDSFAYRALDGENGTSAEAVVTLNVLAVNDVPVAVADSYQTLMDEPLLVDAPSGVLANDGDADPDANLNVVLVTDVTQGSLALSANGSFEYTPAAGYVGADSFSYRVNDGLSDSAPVTVTLDVGPIVTVEPDTLVALALDEGSGDVALDSSGLGNDGTLLGNPVYVADTGDGSAFALGFDGIDDSIDLGPLDVAGSGLTLAAWFKADRYPGTYRDPRLISKASGSAANAHVFMLSTIRSGTQTRLRARVRVGGVTTTLVAGSGNLQTGVWQHGALSYDGAFLRLYLNGVEVGRTALTGAVDTDPSLAVAVGSQPGSSARWFDGLIDDVLILERGLTGEQIQALIAGNVENTPPQAAFSATPSFGVAPLSVFFDATASSDGDGELVSYSWDFGAGNVAEGVTTTHFFTDVGYFPVTLRVMDDRGAVAEVEQTIITSLSGDYGPPTAWRRLSASAGDIPVPGGDGPDQTVALVADVNGDGLNDFVIGTRKGSIGPSLEWWERTTVGWSRQLIEPDLLPLEAGGAVQDIDGDGDPDLVIGEDSSGDRLYWWENPAPDFAARWVRREIKNAQGRQHHDQVFGDFDGDGLTELVYWNNRELSLFIAEIPADPTVEPWPASEIFRAPRRSEGAAAADIDGDGVTDIVAGGYWFKYDGFGGYQANPIDPEMDLTRVLVGQFSGGGRPEIVFDSGDEVGPLRIYQWDGNNWIGRNLAADSKYGHSLNAGDVNGDGNLDIVSGEMFLNESTSPELRLFYGDGQGNFALELIAVGIGNHESKLADLDGDGDLDILGKPFQQGVPELHIWLNEGERLVLDDWERRVLDGAVPYRTIFVEHADLNGDGFEDIISGAWWWKNPGSAAGNWVRSSIGAPLNQMAAVFDFDGDGDADILGTGAIGSAPNSSFYWARNDGAGSFTVLDNIEPAVGTFLQGVTVGEFAPGVTAVALSWQNGNGGLQMLTVPPPASISSEVWSWREVDPGVSGEGLDSGDIDGDGKLDIFDGVTWYRNEGAGAFTRFALTGATSGEPDRNILADMDNDGDLDGVIGFGHDLEGEVAWFEQPDDPTIPWSMRRIDQVAPAQAQSVDVADLDGDGINEVVVGEHTNPEVPGLRLQVYKQGTDSTSWIPYLVYQGDEHHDGAQLFDADNDGDLDIVSIGWLHRRLMLYENRAIQLPPNPIPSVPGALAAVPLSGSRVDLFWEPSTDDNGVVGYAVYRDSLLLANVTSPSWSDLDAGGLSEHYYEVIALDGDGNQSLAASITVSPITSAKGSWWDSNWPYRLLLGVGGNQFERANRVVEFAIDFSIIFAELGEPGALDPTTLRCHEVAADGEIIAIDVPCQFDPSEDFDASTAARGTMLVYATGATPARSARYFHVYFDVQGGAGTASSVNPLVTVDGNAMDEGQTSYLVSTVSGDYHLQKEAGGFSSLLDRDGNDWIDYHPTAGASGSFRGIPNLVYPEAHFHPGSVSAVSELVSSGPLKVTIRSTTLDSLWQVVWEFYPSISRMTVTQAARDYWFLYEGTPGGVLEPNSDFSVTSDGTSRLLAESWNGDLPADEWIYFADPGVGKSLFLANEDDDLAVDSYRPLEGAMTVFGFGRQGLSSGINRVPARFTFGLIETTDFPLASATINAAIKPLALELSPAVAAPR